MERIIDPGNFIEDTDSYKVSHHEQLQPGTQRISSFLESRGGKFPDVTFFGLQYYLKRYLIGQLINADNVQEAAEDFELHFNNADVYNRSGWERILSVHNGCLPARICAVPEGTTVPTHHALMTIDNTDDELPWVTNYIEGLLSMVWYPSTVATQSMAMRHMIEASLERTSDDWVADYMVHDFGWRGSTSPESAGIGGMAHLVAFKGTDTLRGTRYARTYYGERMAGNSIRAAEHSTITSWGRENEAKAYANILDKCPTGAVAVVSDSWDIFNACENIWGKQLRSRVIERDGLLVVRPDSGDPVVVVLRVLDLLGKAFGTTINRKGFRVLHPKIRVIQGDGIDYEMLQRILLAVEEAGWATSNLVFGSGGGLLQKMDRDTQKFAIKCSATKVNGVWHDVMKDPITDPGKRSKAGRLALIKTAEGGFQTIRLEEAEAAGLTSLLRPVFENGRLLVDQSFSEIRSRALGLAA